MKNITKFVALTIVGAATICGAIAKDIEVKGYTKKDGTVVKGYTRHVKDSADDNGKTPAKTETTEKTETKTEKTDKADKAVKKETKTATKTETKADDKAADKSTTEKVKSYTKKDGTVVKGYTRKEPAEKK